MSFIVKNKRPRYLGIGKTGIVLPPRGKVELLEIDIEVRQAAAKG